MNKIFGKVRLFCSYFKITFILVETNIKLRKKLSCPRRRGGISLLAQAKINSIEFKLPIIEVIEIGIARLLTLPRKGIVVLVLS